jgi:FMN reductase
LPSIYATDAQIVWTADQGLRLDENIATRIHDGVDHLSASLLNLHRTSPAACCGASFASAM